jgi:hypothetical protein
MNRYFRQHTNDPKYVSTSLLATCLHAGFLHGLFFDTEDVGDMFLRNVR